MNEQSTVVDNRMSIVTGNLLSLSSPYSSQHHAGLLYPEPMTAQRQTKQFQAIRVAIENAGRPLSIDELHALAAKDIDSLGLRTVYRAIRRLQEDGVIVSVSVPGKSDRYELASIAAKHHHHFHCKACDRFFDIHGCPGGLNKLIPKGFKLENHDLTLSGLCVSCAS